ncbi:DMT family transporter [Jatrophihabitans telluris]|uniref:DMT family transporter n=1 Tax=Jatrophihabitans telluris TaxID=2038343 RepID=A0ABY4QXV9_9ACTN|nr:DMT family transporter [Jatrophihabitans telluris]UQX88214.1 DMT family transporter [Jatrophihabitans telluris]
MSSVQTPAARVGPPAAVPSGRPAGVLLCLVSGVSFGLAAVLAKESFRSGFTVSSLLVGRFGIAAVVFWVIVAVRRPARPSRLSLVKAVGLGGAGYALQSAFYFGALTKLNAAMVAQLLYVYPALVLVIALIRRIESPDGRKLAALLCSAAGLVLLLQGGAGGGSSPALGVAMALGAAGTYALYITVAATLPAELDVYLLSAIVCTAATVSVTCYGVVAGSIHAPAAAAGWGWLVALALVPSVVAIGTFLAGLRLVGGPVAAILSCVEPVVTALSAAVVFGEGLRPLQVLGAGAVLASVVVLQTRRRRRATEDVVPV